MPLMSNETSAAAAIPPVIAPVEATSVPATPVSRRRSAQAVPVAPTVNAHQPNSITRCVGPSVATFGSVQMIVSAAAAGDATTTVEENERLYGRATLQPYQESGERFGMHTADQILERLRSLAQLALADFVHIQSDGRPLIAGVDVE